MQLFAFSIYTEVRKNNTINKVWISFLINHLHNNSNSEKIIEKNSTFTSLTKTLNEFLKISIHILKSQIQHCFPFIILTLMFHIQQGNNLTSGKSQNLPRHGKHLKVGWSLDFYILSSLLLGAHVMISSTLRIISAASVADSNTAWLTLNASQMPCSNMSSTYEKYTSIKVY